MGDRINAFDKIKALLQGCDSTIDALNICKVAFSRIAFRLPLAYCLGAGKNANAVSLEDMTGSGP